MSDEAIINRALNILERRLREPGVSFSRSKEALSYLRLRFAELEHEVFSIVHLTNQHQLIACEELFRGTIDGAAVYPREAVKAALHFNAAAVILTHNHPSGVSEPSMADKAITRKLIAAFEVVDIRVLDHIVVAGQQTYSFAEHGLL